MTVVYHNVFFLILTTIAVGNNNIVLMSLIAENMVTLEERVTQVKKYEQSDNLTHCKHTSMLAKLAC